MEVRTRIAPSPTGDPHVGTPYMALFNLIFAKHHGGKFLLRIEDTDQSRSRHEYEESIYKALQWLGIEWDEGPGVGGPHGPYKQSERTEIYREHCQKLLDMGHAYKCFATAEELKEMRELSAKMGQRMGYDRRYRNLSEEEIASREKAGQPYVIRLKVPLTGECTYEDMTKGRITCPWSDVDDQILLKSDGYPTYHLANVVDDYLMKITHVIRGDEWMASTPKHVLLYDLFGWDRPQFMHMPLLLGADGKKLSKRKNPTSVFYYKESGYLPDAFVNFLTLMGYSMPEDREIYSLDQIIKEFSVKHVGVSGAFFDVKKLDWINQQYLINNIPEQDLWGKIKAWGFSDERMAKIMPLIHTRIKTFGEFMELCNFLFVNHIELSDELLSPKGTEKEVSAALLQAMIWSMEENEDWSRSGFERGSREMAEFFEVNHKKVVMRILFAVITGKHQGPPLFDSIDILGKDRTRARLLHGIEFLGGISNKKMAALKKKWDGRGALQ
ncbi:glutamate--tRNA ligase [Candidatus Neptunochlamydia vexilliferae]|uniref:Glutamate--tRNA ligase n=1 Tax=Candidatus Neptunichlamydia vexilliferae TaxID=1651774 RepID=A0ABS0AX63_9BACT|nr:glutamate--tRNA ligase [Candidatus Neptunochlamydia vexilliferae]MBF5058718.1 Glutamate--tRNA ligase [Candidatus Neptunochlamydia vexilliferae]